MPTGELDAPVHERSTQRIESIVSTSLFELDDFHIVGVFEAPGGGRGVELEGCGKSRRAWRQRCARDIAIG